MSHRHRHPYAACEVCRAYCAPRHNPRQQHWCSAECLMAWIAAELGLLGAMV
jgi:hypothetical protein